MERNKNPNEPVLIDVNTTIETIRNLKEGFIIVGGPQEQIWGTLDLEAMFVWTSLQKAEEFKSKNNLQSEEKIIGKPFSEILELANSLPFRAIRFDFQAAGAHPKQAFVNYKLNGGGILNLLAFFNSLSETKFQN